MLQKRQTARAGEEASVEWEAGERGRVVGTLDCSFHRYADSNVLENLALHLLGANLNVLSFCTRER